jgi:hypothetical protein
MRRWRSRTVLALAGIAAALIPTATAMSSASAATTGTYEVYILQSQISLLCISTTNGSTATSAAIVQAPCDLGGAPEYMHWIAFTKPGSPGIVWFANMYTDEQTQTWKCINVAGASLSNNAKLIQYPCGSPPKNDLWTPGLLPTSQSQCLPVDHCNATIPNYLSGKCINVPGNSMAEGVQLIQYTCGTGNQKNDLWELFPVRTETLPVPPFA